MTTTDRPDKASLLVPRIRGLLIFAWGAGSVVFFGGGLGWPGALGAALIWWLAWLEMERLQCARWSSRGRRDAGVLFFAEAARWLCIRWSYVRLARGLRAGGYEGRVELFQWCGNWRGLLAIPALMSHRQMRRRGKRLAEKIVRYHEQYPGRPIDLIGYSCGAYVVLVALEALPETVSVRTVLLLGPTVRPDYDLTAALRRVDGRMIALTSSGDWFVNGLGPLLFGTADRRHTPAAGMVGFRMSPHPEVADRFVDLRYRRSFARSGYLGDHFTVACGGLARDHLADWLEGRKVPAYNDI